MDVDAITAGLINRTLRAWQQGQQPPTDLLALDLLQEPAPLTDAERQVRLESLITRIVETNLSRIRRSEGLPEGFADKRPELLAELVRDFATGNGTLQAWSALYHRYLSTVPIDINEMAGVVPIAPRHFRRHVESGTRRLANELRRAELAVHDQARVNRRRRYLPPPDYTQLFGIETQKRELYNLFNRPDGPHFVSIEGLGGIGKTALARAATSQLAETSDFDGIAWVSARQSHLNDDGAIVSTADPSGTVADIITRLAAQLGLTTVAGLGVNEKLEHLATFLANARYLIVIDNLESVSDVDTLLPAVTQLAGPSRFLFTSRQSMSRYQFVHRRVVSPLDLEESRALVESELSRRDRREKLEPEDMAALYELVGGLPLALKLVAAQVSRWPISILLDNMRQANRRAPENLYNFIYRRTWLALDDKAKELLLSLLDIAPEGEDIEWLQLISGLSSNEFDEALAQLLGYSLLDVIGPPDIPRYRMHRLTATFLHTDILAGWANRG